MERRNAGQVFFLYNSLFSLATQTLNQELYFLWLKITITHKKTENVVEKKIMYPKKMCYDWKDYYILTYPTHNAKTKWWSLHDDDECW